MMRGWTGWWMVAGIAVVGAAVTGFPRPIAAEWARAPIVVVFNVEAKGVALGRDVLDNLTDFLVTRLGENGRFQVVPRAQLKARLTEAKTESYKECYDESCQIELGREMAAQKSLATRIAKLGSQCTVHLNLYDLGRSASENAAMATGACTEDGIVAALGQAATRLLGEGGGGSAPGGTGGAGGGATQGRGAGLADGTAGAGASGTAGPAGGPGTAGTRPVVGGGKVEAAAPLDKGESIVNAVTDQTGFLVIKTEPAGAQVSLNGKPVGTANGPLQLEQMVGKYVLVAEMGRLYHPARQEVDLTTSGARVTLTLLPAFGRIEVTSEPGGAEVWVDGEKVGTTPWTQDRKPSGTYDVRVVKANWLAQDARVVVADGQTARLAARLEQNFGGLTVESDPPGAAVTLNDEATGKTTPWTFPAVQPGVAVVKLALDGYGEVVERATVQNRETALVRAKLAAKMGLLVVTSAYDDGTACEGEVRVDGKVVGQTPWKGEVVATQHEVVVKCEKGGAKASAAVAHNGRENVALKVSSGPKPDLKWVSIRGGTFEMGSGNGDEWPTHQVTVKDFQMAKTEITVAEYRACVHGGGCTDSGVTSCGQYGNWDKGNRGDHPMNCIDWSQAEAFCRWVGGRLPSEAEWEYAARSGGRRQQYPWGNDKARCYLAVMKDDGSDGCGQDSTWPGCSKTQGNTADGLCDMAGNVYEWVQDWYHRTYDGAPADGRAWEDDGSYRVNRGGGWLDVETNLLAARRNRSGPSNRSYALGARCLRSLHP